MDLHGGRLSVHSEGEGLGCTFTLHIPITDEPAFRVSYRSNAIPRPEISVISSSRIGRVLTKVCPVDIDPDPTRIMNESYESSKTTQSVDEVVQHHAFIQSRDRVRVLVVDDANSNRKMLCRLLQHKYVTREAEDGQEAVDMVLASQDTDHSIQVVLMDNHMPRMDGPTACKLLRERGYQGVIIGVTGDALSEDVEYYLLQGANKVLTKPVDVGLLERTIRGTIIVYYYAMLSTTLS